MLFRSKDNSYAEENSVYDVEGIDLAHKMIILSNVAYNEWVDYDLVDIRGIKNINIDYIKEVKKRNKKIKLIGESYYSNNKIKISVKPKEIDSSDPFFNIDYEENSVEINGEFIDNLILRGKGAGGYPTASSVFSDLNDIVTLLQGRK